MCSFAPFTAKEDVLCTINQNFQEVINKEVKRPHGVKSLSEKLTI